MDEANPCPKGLGLTFIEKQYRPDGPRSLTWSSWTCWGPEDGWDKFTFFVSAKFRNLAFPSAMKYAMHHCGFHSRFFTTLELLQISQNTLHARPHLGIVLVIRSTTMVYLMHWRGSIHTVSIFTTSFKNRHSLSLVTIVILCISFYAFIHIILSRVHSEAMVRRHWYALQQVHASEVVLCLSLDALAHFTPTWSVLSWFPLKWGQQPPKKGAEWLKARIGESFKVPPGTTSCSSHRFPHLIPLQLSKFSPRIIPIFQMAKLRFILRKCPRSHS